MCRVKARRPEWASVFLVLLVSASAHLITATPKGKMVYLAVMSSSEPRRPNSKLKNTIRLLNVKLFFFHHPALFFSSSRDSMAQFFTLIPSLRPLQCSLNLHPSLSTSRPLTSNWRGSSYCYCSTCSIWAIFVSHYTW